MEIEKYKHLFTPVSEGYLGEKVIAYLQNVNDYIIEGVLCNETGEYFIHDGKEKHYSLNDIIILDLSKLTNFEALQMFVKQNEDDFDRGKGKYLIEQFINQNKERL